MPTLAYSLLNTRSDPIFKVVLVEPGQTYGRLQEDGTRPCVANQAMLEFWDTRFPHDKEHGAQFVSRYYLDTLTGRGWGHLLLDTASPDWQVDAHDLSLALSWASRHLAGKRHSAQA